MTHLPEPVTRPPARPRPGTPPVRLALPGRTLLLVAGMPGAGKSTLLRTLASGPGVVVLDSEAVRAALARALPALPYGGYCVLVHLAHRLGLLTAAVSARPTVVVHLRATAPRTRAAVVRLAACTGRAAHLLWVDAAAADALRGQRERGRVASARSFAGHLRRASVVAVALRSGTPPAGWRSVTVVDRETARGGLHLDTGAATDPHQ